MRRVLSFKLLLAALLAACVTVNVYFPTAAAEQAADKIIDTVTSQPPASESSPPPQAPREPPHSRRPEPTGSVLLAATAGVVNLLIPAAYAQANANLDVSSPQIRAVTASMQQRFGDLRKYFESGALGLTPDGQVTVRDQNAIPLTERPIVTRLVAEDNRDRATLYAEIAKANGHPEWEQDIRRTFARRWVERGAQPGWYYRDATGNWLRR